MARAAAAAPARARKIYEILTTADKHESASTAGPSPDPSPRELRAERGEFDGAVAGVRAVPTPRREPAVLAHARARAGLRGFAGSVIPIAFLRNAVISGEIWMWFSFLSQ